VSTTEDHRSNCKEAADRYLAGRNAISDAEDWKFARWEARRMIVDLFRDSSGLENVNTALTISGRHMTVLRHLLAPPISQDQFRLFAKSWIKATEKNGKPVKPAAADQISTVFEERRDRRLTPWLTAKRTPKMAELLATLGTVGPLIASQRLATARRTRLAELQERDAIALLEQSGWLRQQSRLITTGGALGVREFMHKARFKSGKKENQEIDIACGLGDTYILAVECKVTNDETNSIKRMNDILKKATAWRAHWGNYVIPAAILEGNIKFADVERLLEAQIEVFWSHRLNYFAEWLEGNSK
jgi:hypothetical protein